MSGEFEAAGAMATAGLAAGAIEGREAHGAGDGVCLNCGAHLAGPYCSSCGQAAHAHRTLLHMIEEALHGIIHFDTKAWRTLPMLAFRPGTLTRNYIYGKRARYISPLALFLFTIFLMFFVFAFAKVEVDGTVTQDRGDLVRALDEAKTELAREQRELAEAAAAPPDPYTGDLDVRLAQQAVSLAQAEVDRRRQALERFGSTETARGAETPSESDTASESHAAPAAAGPSEEEVVDANPAPSNEGAVIEPGQGRWQDQVSEAAKSGKIQVGTPWPAFNERVVHSLENPDLALYKIQQAAYKFSFLLVPISLPFLWLLFIWRRGLTLYDHMVFILYSLSFASVVFLLLALMNDVDWLNWLAATLAFSLPVHMFFHLKGAYALGWWSAIWRIWLLLLSAVISLSVFVATIVLLGLGG